MLKHSFLAWAERHMPKSCKILFSEQAPTQYFTAFCRMAELLLIKILFFVYILTIYTKNVILLLEKLIEREIKESSIEDLIVERD